MKAQTKTNQAQTLDESFLTKQLVNAKERLARVQAERRRLIDAFQGGFIMKEEFEQRAGTVVSRISQLQDDLQVLKAEQNTASDGKSLLTKLSYFTSTVTDRLDRMTFHERQELARQVLEEVVLCDNTVKLFFKIPLTSSESSAQKKTESLPNVSTQLNLRSCSRVLWGLHS
jgi:vacuolar-type H+-ATPase subunit I/STV1